MHCPAGYQYAVSGPIVAEKMKWQVVRNKIAVSRYYRLKEWPWRFIALGVAAVYSLDCKKRCT
jgi:hypothetical protein